MNEVTEKRSPNKNTSVVVASTITPPFVLDDVRMLGGHYSVDVLIAHGFPAIFKFFLCGARADLTFCWFGSVYSFFAVLGAKLFGKKSVIMLGGVDTAKYPEIGYGLWVSRWKSALLRRALSLTDAVLAVDDSLRLRLERSSGRTWPGVVVVPTGFDAEEWTPGPEGLSRQGVLCVARCNSAASAWIKGLDVLVSAAAQLPDTQFTVVGADPGIITSFATGLTPNVRLLPPVPRGELIGEYRAHKVYCQPSRSEGLPNALCEAMLCGCIPVGADAGGVRTAIGGTGAVVATNDPAALAKEISTALLSTDSAGLAARERIAGEFTRERREQALTAIIDRLISQ